MDLKKYVEDAIRTEAPVDQAKERLQDDKMIRLLHSAMGLETEVGEFMDPLKKGIFYGKDIDYVNLAEEIGDMCWYMAIACDALDVDLESVMKTNIEKLKARYPDKFTKDDAIIRDLDAEREILEKTSDK